MKHGGRIVDLDEPKLTHVVVDKRDDSRRLELIKRTSKSVLTPYRPSHYGLNAYQYVFRPKRRHLIISEYVQACLDEATLLDEDGEFFVLYCGNRGSFATEFMP